MRTVALCLFTLLLGCRPVEVPASALRLKVAVSPVVSKTAGDSIRIFIWVANPRLQPVHVNLGPGTRFGYGGAPRSEGISCGWEIRAAPPGTNSGPSGGLWGQHVIRFGPLRYRRCQFAIPVNEEVRQMPGGSTRSSGEDLPPGEYLVIASFGKQEAAPVRFVVRP
jgi:hypothetical protein